MPSQKKNLPPSTSLPANGLTSQASQRLPPRQRLPFPAGSQQSRSHPQKQQLWPVCTWSAHAPQIRQSPSPFPRYSHTLTATATATGELFLFGGDVRGFASNDLYVFSTRDFSSTLLQTSGEVPSPRVAHGAALTSDNVLIWGGITNFSNQNVLNQRHDDSLYLLNLGTSYLLMARQTPPDQSFLCSSIARVDPHCGQWSWAQ